MISNTVSQLHTRVRSPQGVAGAIAVIAVEGHPDAIDTFTHTNGWGTIHTGTTTLRRVFNTDDALLVRWDPHTLELMPHGGVAVVRAILQHLPPPTSHTNPTLTTTLAQAASPAAVDILLSQPHGTGQPDPTLDRLLNRLIHPPLVAVVGGANIGKSSLTNALARRTVSVVADAPGTTRDHVGVQIQLPDGLVIRWIDTPGIRPTPTDAIEAAAHTAARAVIQSCDLLVLCGDAAAPPPLLDAKVPVVRVALRADLGLPGWDYEFAVSTLNGSGLEELSLALSERLVPRAAREDPRPWRYWTALVPGG